MLALADSSGPKSGRFASSTGVGTVTMKTLQPVNATGSAVSLSRVAAASASGPVSPVWSRPAPSSEMRPGSMSKPSVSNCLPNSTASGRPT